MPEALHFNGRGELRRGPGVNGHSPACPSHGGAGGTEGVEGGPTSFPPRDAPAPGPCSAALRQAEEALDQRASASRRAGDVLKELEERSTCASGVLDRLAAAPQTARSMLARFYEQETR